MRNVQLINRPVCKSMLQIIELAILIRAPVLMIMALSFINLSGLSQSFLFSHVLFDN